MRTRLVTKCGRVTEIKPDDHTRVRMDTGPGNFREVLKIITRHSTSMISNDTQSQSEHSILQYCRLNFLCCCGRDKHITKKKMKAIQCKRTIFMKTIFLRQKACWDLDHTKENHVRMQTAPIYHFQSILDPHT